MGIFLLSMLIETRIGKRGNKQHTEIRLVPLYDNSNNLSANEDMSEDTFDKIPASFDKLTPNSTRNTVPVIVPVSGTKTGTVESPNPLCHKASQPPNIDKDKDKDFHSVNSSQYDSIRTENSSKNGSIHIKAYLYYCT